MFRRESRPAIQTLIGTTALVRGDVEFEGGLHLDGRIIGAVRATGGDEATLTVSAGGSLEGQVEVPNVLLEGAVKGDIHARGRVVLGASAVVEGDVHYGMIEMTVGARITGKLVRLAHGTEPAAPPRAPKL